MHAAKPAWSSGPLTFERGGRGLGRVDVGPRGGLAGVDGRGEGRAQGQGVAGGGRGGGGGAALGHLAARVSRVLDQAALLRQVGVAGTPAWMDKVIYHQTLCECE